MLRIGSLSANLDPNLRQMPVTWSLKVSPMRRRNRQKMMLKRTRIASNTPMQTLQPINFSKLKN